MRARPISRRVAVTLPGLTTVANLFNLAPHLARAAEPIETFPGNPQAVRVTGFTLVTTDMQRSLNFYQEAYGYDDVVTGVLGNSLPTVQGAGDARRRYALLSFKSRPDVTIRLLEAPAGTAPNRPIGASLLEPGLVAIDGTTRDIQASYDRLVGAGLKAISEPLREVHGDLEWVSYCGTGPSGENIFVSRLVSNRGKPVIWAGGTALHTPIVIGALMCLDRWPMLDFYNRVFELTPTKEGSVEDESVVRLMGLPPDTFLRYANIGQGASVEWWENRQYRPPGNIHPTALDRTGIAMMTFTVNNVTQTRRRAEAAGYTILGEGVFPTLGANRMPGFYVRGSQGELLEVIGRT